MKRNLEKMIDEYRQKYEKGPRGQFAADDLQRIKELAERAAGPGARPGSILYHAVTRALAVGFIAGYRVRKAEEQEKRREQRAARQG